MTIVRKDAYITKGFEGVRKMRVLYPVSIILLLIIMSGCTSKYHSAMGSKTTPSRLHTQTSNSLYGFFDANITAQAPKSGFYPLSNNVDAFAARVGLIRQAKKTLDVQYYIIMPDNTGLTLTKLLLDAADRGVKVRVILDDMLQGESDASLGALNGHPNISIKLFNPTNFRKSLHYLEMAFHVNTLGRRMHNKAIVADNSVAIIGGRNIQDIYFAADEDTIFIDNDIMAVGPLVTKISNEFETYWSSPVCIPFEKVSGETPASLNTLRNELDAYVTSIAYTDYMNAVRECRLTQEAESGKLGLIFGKSELYYDLPTKVTTSEEKTDTHLSEHIAPIIKNAKKSIFIVSPYFMPSAESMEALKVLRKNGVEITILTNSLATNDAIPVYSAYSKYHKELLRSGVKLYELSPVAFHRIFKDAHYRPGKIPRSALHAKSMIIDDEIFIIGSANMDPRSHKLNTELVAVIHSEELARTEHTLLERAISLENAFELSLEPAPPKRQVATWVPQEEERVVWTTIVDGKLVRYYNDGNAGFWRILGANLVYYFPIEGYL